MGTQGKTDTFNFRYVLCGFFILLVTYLNIILIKFLFDFGFFSEYVKSFSIPWVIALPQVFLGIFVLYGIKTGRLPHNIINFRKPSWIQVIFSISVVLINFLFIYVYLMIVADLGINIIVPSMVPQDILGYGVVIYINLLTICLFVPIIEEVFFRGFLLNAFIGKMKFIYAVLVSSGIFAIMHGAIGFFVPVFFSSVMISFLYYKTKTIWTPIIVHSLQNLIVVMVASAA